MKFENFQFTGKALMLLHQFKGSLDKEGIHVLDRVYGDSDTAIELWGRYEIVNYDLLSWIVAAITVEQLIILMNYVSSEYNDG